MTFLVRPAVREALDRAAEAGDDAAAWGALGRIDPLLRPLARRLLRRAVEDALLEEPGASGPRLIELARARLGRGGGTSLGGTGGGGRAGEPGGTLARIGRRMASFWWATTSAVLFALLAGAFGARTFVRALREPPRYDASRRPAPRPAGVFLTGGRPAASHEAVHRALERDIPEFLVALDAWAEARHRGHADLPRAERELSVARDRILGPEVKDALGEAGARRLRDVLARARAAHEAAPAVASEAADAFLEAVGAFDDVLAARGLAYFVDGDVLLQPGGRRLVILYSFAVVHVTIFESEGRPVRALHLRRLDHLNWEHALLGFTRPHLREALVLLDPLERLLVTYVLPSLAEDGGVPLVDAESLVSAPPWRLDVERRAGQIVRADYGATPGLDREAAEELGRLLGRRNQLFVTWKPVLQARGITLEPPPGLLLPDGYAGALVGAVPADELDELGRIERALATSRLGRTFEALRSVLAAAIERHEVQHRLDFARAFPPPMPQALEVYVGPARGPEGEERRFAAQARDELSAYLAELARDDRTVRVGLTLLSRFLFDKGMWGSAESYAALVVFEGLAHLRGLGDVRLLREGTVDRAALARLYLSLTDLPPETLRADARRLWEALFGEPLPPLRAVSPP